MEPDFRKLAMYQTLDKFIQRQCQKAKIAIQHEDLELLSLLLKTNYPEEYIEVKSKDKSFFVHLLLFIRKELERRSGKLLFLCLRDGNYVILDSWHVKKHDWDVEARHRKPEFLHLRDLYFIAKDKVNGIKSFEDFTAIVAALSWDDLNKLFGQEDSQFLKEVVSRLGDL